MKAWISDQKGPQGLSLGNQPLPEPGPEEVVIQVHAAALNFSDLLMIGDAYQVRPPRPFVPGQEVSGVVVKAASASPWKTGDRVATKVNWGGFAEYACVPANMPIALPAEIDHAEAACVPVSYTTAMVALTECAPFSPGDFILVHAAAGGVGIASVQIATGMGATVIATAGNPEKLELARSYGADHLVNYRDPDWVRQVREIAGDGARVIVDPVGGAVGEDSLRCLARDGTLLIVGFASGAIPKLAANRLLLKRASARGVYWNHSDDVEMLERVSARIIKMLNAGIISPVVDARDGLEALPQALDDLAARRTSGKIVLRLRNKEE
ncbi:MAG: NADPH:quinone oxidoreductase family protein [Rhizobiaceae bacterium]|nr:NADPH:quinone oxidoreductase family protein [Rhizobiaceae bacterium]